MRLSETLSVPLTPGLTPDLLRRIMPEARRRADRYAEPLRQAMARFGILTPARMAGFLANVAHESGQLAYTAEIASGEAYEGRTSLGNTHSGDGKRFKGRGLIQITGRANYARASLCLVGNPTLLLECPEMLETTALAAESAAWFWFDKGLNEIMDQGDFRGACALINTGDRQTTTGRINGFAERLSFYSRARAALTNEG